MDYIYIVLEKSHTLLGKVSRLTDGYDYTHITLSLDEKLDRFYSFSRFWHYAPFSSGFMKETLDCYAYGKNESVKLKVFKIPVSREEKNKVKHFIKNVSDDRNNYVFNLYSALTMPLFHGFRIYKTYNCMSFCARALSMISAVTLEKPYYKYTIAELDELLSEYVYDEREFTREKIENEHYMRKIPLMYNIGAFVRLNVILINRLLFKFNQKEKF
ncbi:MAG: hypothetical protein J5856_08620 [Lachnospiraceae bacterium]|nr:hypothetical protein [Lachnospiraceae bacterium]